MCYLPTWPVGFPLGGDKPPSPSDPDKPDPERLTSFDFRSMVIENLAEVSNAITPELDEWMRPQPKCVRRIQPYELKWSPTGSLRSRYR